jgi:hypothetical protein
MNKETLKTGDPVGGGGWLQLFLCYSGTGFEQFIGVTHST